MFNFHVRDTFIIKTRLFDPTLSLNILPNNKKFKIGYLKLFFIYYLKENKTWKKYTAIPSLLMTIKNKKECVENSFFLHFVSYLIF